MKEYYHGTNVEDGFSILGDGMIFSRSFLTIKDRLAEEGWDENRIYRFLRELHSVSPPFSPSPSRLKQAKEDLKNVFVRENIEDLAIEIKNGMGTIKNSVLEYALDTNKTLIYFSDYPAAVGAIIPKYPGRGFTSIPEGVVFSYESSGDNEEKRDVYLRGLVEVSNLDRMYILSNDAQNIDGLRRKADIYSLDILVVGADLSEDSFGASNAYIRSLEVAQQMSKHFKKSGIFLGKRN